MGYLIFVILTSAITGTVIAFLTRGITFYAANTDNEKIVKAGAHMKHWGWPSGMHRFADGKAHMKEFAVFLLAVTKCFLRDKKSDYALVVSCILVNCIPAVLIFLVASKYWTVEIGLWFFILYITSFWPILIALWGGVVAVAQLCCLTSVYFLQLAWSAVLVHKFIWYFLSGCVIGLMLFSSATSRKYLILCLPAFFWSLRDKVTIQMILKTDFLKTLPLTIICLICLFLLLILLTKNFPLFFLKSFMKIVKISPDRICFNYLHYSPKFARHQRVMIDGRQGRPGRLPDQYERKMVFLEAMKILTDNGYVRTGYDHFTKSTDAVAKAMQRQEMGWNALGVTAGRYSDVIGIGSISVSTIGEYYFQNVFDLADYKTAVTCAKFPVYRGHRLSADDLIRWSIIQTLRNFFILDFNEIEKKYNINFKEYFKDELAALAGLIKDEIVEVADNTIRIIGLVRQFADIVCAAFDRYVPKVDENVRRA